jgi:hypothetical protein
LTPILIRKDPNRYENLLYNKEDFQSVIDEVDLSDILDYIVSAIDGDWAPSCYWKHHDVNDNLFVGQLEWIIYSYLVHKGLLMVEDQYFRYNTSRIEKYRDRYGYYNPLERDLYIPIINRMVDEKYLINVDNRYYKLGPIYWRNNNLENIFNEV